MSIMARFAVLLITVGLIATLSLGQQETRRIVIRVAANHTEPGATSMWNYFGYDEPNYTYAPNGRKLLGELAQLSRQPVYARPHNLLTTGDGAGSLKWGSTNIYTEDPSGNALYSWQIVDRIFDTFHRVDQCGERKCATELLFAAPGRFAPESVACSYRNQRRKLALTSRNSGMPPSASL